MSFPNRELSQFASFLTINDIDQNISITNNSTPSIGIGTTVIEQKLHVAGNVKVTGFITANQFYGDGSNLSGVAAVIDGYFIPTLTGIYTGANVGIGTSTFTNKLNVDGNVGITSQLFAYTITSNAMEGISPFVVNSSSLVANLNTDLFRGRTPPVGVFIGDIDTQTLSNKTFISPVISSIVNGVGILTVPSQSGTLIYENTNNVTGVTSLSATNVGVAQTITAFNISATNVLTSPTINGTTVNATTIGVTTVNSTTVNATTVNATTFVGNGITPIGGIIMWSGTLATAAVLEPGWAICDGRTVNGRTTPDLRNRFIIGASADSGGQSQTTVTAGNTKTGGSKDAIIVSHTHTGGIGAAGGHSHSGSTTVVGDHAHVYSISSGSTAEGGGDVGGSFSNAATGGAGAHSHGLAIDAVGNHTHTLAIDATGSSATNANLPPYYALAFIMRTA